MDKDDLRNKDSDFQFRQFTIDELLAIDGVTPEVVEGFRETCQLVSSERKSTPAGERKKELKKLSGYLQRLSKLMVNTASESYLDLASQAESESPTNALLEPNIDGNWSDANRGRHDGDGMRFCSEVISFKRLVDRTIANLRTAPGRKPIKQARFLAEITALRLHMHGIVPSTYDDGTYMKVLELLFAEVYPTEKASGFLRHGRWALDQIEGLDNE